MSVPSLNRARRALRTKDVPVSKPSCVPENSKQAGNESGQASPQPSLSAILSITHHPKGPQGSGEDVRAKSQDQTAPVAPLGKEGGMVRVLRSSAASRSSIAASRWSQYPVITASNCARGVFEGAVGSLGCAPMAA